MFTAPFTSAFIGVSHDEQTVVVYGTRTVTYNDDYCTLATVGSRVRAEYVTSEDDEGAPFGEYWNRDEWERKEATLHKRDGEYYLHVAMEKEPETDALIVEKGAVLGVDLNVDGHLAVTSTGTFLGNADFLNHKRDEYERRRGRLQQTGTRSAHLTVQSIGDRFADRVKTTSTVCRKPSCRTLVVTTVRP
ncbi:hypothetical protein [Haloplanus salilacus]|uniref:hypothetical protein n=1 Tax=Haloplanus salilacus TaxID=2949994 RepID=UPI0030D45EA5